LRLKERIRKRNRHISRGKWVQDKDGKLFLIKRHKCPGCGCGGHRRDTAADPATRGARCP
jgi:hypothetical protein